MRCLQLIILGLLVIGAGIMSSGPALGHSIYIYAWPEGSQLCSKSYYTKTSMVIGGKVTMLGAQEDVIQEGVTDEQGIACFNPPGRAQELTFVVSPGQGHQATYQLQQKLVENAIAAHAQQKSLLPGQEAGTTSGVKATAQQALAEKAIHYPGVEEIATGIGAIAALTALAHFYRKKKR